ncbi:MAG: hypothetical protein IJ434_00090 [Alistipes sp.]|nr:hypothetical protein [Alistipes sp.]
MKIRADPQAKADEQYAADAKVFAKLTEAYVASAETYVMNSTGEDVALMSEVQEQY